MIDFNKYKTSFRQLSPLDYEVRILNLQNGVAFGLTLKSPQSPQHNSLLEFFKENKQHFWIEAEQIFPCWSMVKYDKNWINNL